MKDGAVVNVEDPVNDKKAGQIQYEANTMSMSYSNLSRNVVKLSNSFLPYIIYNPSKSIFTWEVCTFLNVVIRHYYCSAVDSQDVNVGSQFLLSYKISDNNF